MKVTGFFGHTQISREIDRGMKIKEVEIEEGNSTKTANTY
ncbi:hypothetical protein KNP414_00908 [Paenibacillus mucilaginosus KNP414]|uniref:Uncharacterized protein n=1 Tax=Paenibacillus mucilaginosus (strain KNP414) TaxID=1036673 RepID=F8F7L3_PAEMK|nr:hypothetical protein KNP414_00908 [Paenibacillus mucilaginosus KNP414]